MAVVVAAVAPDAIVAAVVVHLVAADSEPADADDA